MVFLAKLPVHAFLYNHVRNVNTDRSFLMVNHFHPGYKVSDSIGEAAGSWVYAAVYGLF